MNDKVTVNNNNGIGCLGALQIIFIVLKVLDLIDWSWWAVFIPTWIGIGLIIIAIVLGTIVIMYKEMKK